LLYALLLAVIVTLAYAVIGFLGIGSSSSTVPLPVDTTATAELGTFRSITTGSTDTGDVSIELTPHQVQDGILEVSAAINTHSVALDSFQLKEMTVLEYKSKKIVPISAPQLQGHHTSGKFLFEVEENIQQFTITIVGIPKIEKRVYTWE